MYKAWDVNIGMFFSNLVMYFIIFVTAATLFAAGKTDINSATDAAEALRPLAGDGAKYLLAFGLIGAGLLAVPVLTGSAAFAISDVFWLALQPERKADAREAVLRGDRRSHASWPARQLCRHQPD